MKLLPFLLLLSLAFMTSCGGDMDCTAEGFDNETRNKFDKLSDAANEYAQDDSEDNCKKLREAAEDYLDAVESFSSCPDLNQDEFEQALQTARDNLNSVPCN